MVNVVIFVLRGVEGCYLNGVGTSSSSISSSSVLIIIRSSRSSIGSSHHVTRTTSSPIVVVVTNDCSFLRCCGEVKTMKILIGVRTWSIVAVQTACSNDT